MITSIDQYTAWTANDALHGDPTRAEQLSASHCCSVVVTASVFRMSARAGRVKANVRPLDTSP